MKKLQKIKLSRSTKIADVPISFIKGVIQIPFAYLISIFCFLAKSFAVSKFILVLIISGDGRWKKCALKLGLELFLQFWMIQVFTPLLPFFLAMKSYADYSIEPQPLSTHLKKQLTNESNSAGMITLWKMLKTYAWTNGWTVENLLQCGGGSMPFEQKNHLNHIDNHQPSSKRIRSSYVTRSTSNRSTINLSPEEIEEEEVWKMKWKKFVDKIRIAPGNFFFYQWILKDAVAFALGPHSMYLSQDEFKKANGVDVTILRHEICHCLQFLESNGGYLSFFSVYFADGLSNWILYKFDVHKAYQNIVAEKQAYYFEKLRKPRISSPYNVVPSLRSHSFAEYSRAQVFSYEPCNPHFERNTNVSRNIHFEKFSLSTNNIITEDAHTMNNQIRFPNYIKNKG